METCLQIRLALDPDAERAFEFGDPAELVHDDEVAVVIAAELLAGDSKTMTRLLLAFYCPEL